MKGIEVISKLSATDNESEFYTDGQSQVFGLIHDPSPMSDLPKALLTLTYSGVIENQICIDSIIDLVDIYSQKLSIKKAYPLCELSTSTERIEIKDIGIYPNPASDVIKIDGLKGKPYELQIIDLNGNITYSSSIVRKDEVSVANLPSGLYFAKLSIGAYYTVIALLVQ